MQFELRAIITTQLSIIYTEELRLMIKIIDIRIIDENNHR